MGFFTVLTIAVGLAMDAFSVSVATGAVYKRFHIGSAFKMAFAFGLFQALMPIIGWSSGLSLKNYFEAYDHWVAFVILLLIGSKMIYESFTLKEAQGSDYANEQENSKPQMTMITLLWLAIATSIDALAVGFTLSLLNVHIISTVLIIGIVTFALCYGGVYLGSKFGHIFENKIEVAGGLILILIGTKILLSHIYGINIV